MAFSVSSQLRGGGKACDAVQTDLLLCLVIAASFAEEMALPPSSASYEVPQSSSVYASEVASRPAINRLKDWRGRPGT